MTKKIIMMGFLNMLIDVLFIYRNTGKGLELGLNFIR